MRTIFKYPLELNLEDTLILTLPWGAMPLSVGVQNGRIMLWALVDPDQTEMADLPFGVMPIGGPDLPEHFNANDFMGTVQMGVFVFHVFVKGGRQQV